ncbi:methyltransferase [Nonomuraea sp. NPDC050536]|uniref:methyltransferase n=1 Tax=Nonomuraea sp. NPDC050536 TaxID=3364366 RepID=UPI0037C73DDD
MPLFPNPVEAAAFRLSIVPPMLADYFGVLGFHTLVAGVRLGIFDALRATPMSPSRLAGSLGLAPRAAEAMLRALHGLGYVKERRGVYRLTRTAKVWLCADSPMCLAEGLDFWERCATDLWRGLEKAARDGSPEVPFYTLTEGDPALSRSFQAWTAAVARRQGPATARAIPVHRDARHVLDLGGSHTAYSMALLERHPLLRSTVIDLPTALASARPHPRITLRTGSFLEEDLGEGYDVALLFNVIHGLDDAELAGLLGRVAQALNPGGMLVIGDQFRGAMPGRASRTLLNLLDLNYLIAGGWGIRSYREVARLVGDAGFSRPRHRRPPRAPASELAIAIR